MDKFLYQDLYETEDTHWWHIAKRRLVVELLHLHLPHKKGLKILDIGCGTGKNLEVWSQFGEVWGVDISQEAINFCKKRGLKNVVVGKTEKIPFKADTFDCVTGLDLLEHTNDVMTVSESYRVLKPNGVLIVTVPAFQRLWSRWDEVLHHKRRYNKHSLSKVLTNGGFKIERISFAFATLLLPSIFVRAIKSVVYHNKKFYPSDFKASLPGTNMILGKLADCERWVIKKWGLPVGLSVVAVARKENNV